MVNDDASNELKKKLLAALQKGGYALEMRVAAKAKKTNAAVGQSRYYVDPTSGKTREIDVVALWVATDSAELGSSPSLAVVGMLIECKSKPSPWVVFDENIRPQGLQVDFHYRGTPKVFSPTGQEYFENLILDPDRQDELRETVFTVTPHGLGSGVVEVPLKGDEEYKSNQPNGAWSAVQGAVSAATGMQQEWLDKSESDPHPFPSISLWIPVVVTSGKLFRAWLEDDEMQLEEISRASVTLRAGKDMTYIRCYVATEDEVEKLLQEAENTYRFLMQAEPASDANPSADAST